MNNWLFWALCAAAMVLAIGCASAPKKDERPQMTRSQSQALLRWYSAMRTEKFLQDQWQFAKDCGESQEAIDSLGDQWNVAKRAEDQALADYLDESEEDK
jgi:hypothetical protein